MSKTFELCLATLMDAHLVTSDNQFSFKQQHSTDICIYTVKSIIQYYNYYNSPVYTCFLVKISDRTIVLLYIIEHVGVTPDIVNLYITYIL